MKIKEFFENFGDIFYNKIHGCKKIKYKMKRTYFIDNDDVDLIIKTMKEENILCEMAVTKVLTNRRKNFWEVTIGLDGYGVIMKITQEIYKEYLKRERKKLKKQKNS